MAKGWDAGGFWKKIFAEGESLETLKMVDEEIKKKKEEKNINAS